MMRSTKAFEEHWIHEDAVECPELMTKEALLKFETKVKVDQKEEVKYERDPCSIPKKTRKT